MIDAAIKERLRCLFAVAENDASYDGEIDNALRMAKNLMAAHQVTRDDVFEGDDGEVNITNVVYGQGKRYSHYSAICAWESYLCRFVTEFVSGVSYYITTGQLRRNAAGMATGKRATQITFYGPGEDVQFATELFDEVSLFVQAAAKLRYGAALARGAAASYAEGFAKGLWDANKREAKKLEGTSDKTALMVVNRSVALVEGGKNWLAETQGVTLGKGRSLTSQSHKNYGAYNQGKTDGKNYKPASQKRAGHIG